MKPCEVCQQPTSLYRCPRCLTITCSLQCCVEHKLKKGCNGKRNRAAYCAIENFTDSQLASDYHFLEDVLNVTQSGQRLFHSVTKTSNTNHSKKVSSQKRIKTATNKPTDDLDEAEDYYPAPIQPLLRLAMSQPGQTMDGGNTNENSHHSTSSMDGQFSFKQQRLVQQARERGCTLLLMPTGMERQRNNTTFYSPKQDRITWKLEWIFHLSQQAGILGRRDTSTAQTSSNGLLHREIICDTQVPESVILKDYLHQHVLQGKQAKSTLKPFCSALALSHCVSSDVCHTNHSSQHTGKHQEEDLFPLLLFMKKIPSSSASPIYIPLDPHQTLKAALHGKTLIEFPTVDIVLPCDSHLIPCMVKEV